MATEITFNGETIVDTAEQARAFADAVLGTVGATVKTKPLKVATPTATASAPSAPAQTDAPAQTTVSATDAKAMETAREGALDKLRTMYATGKPGQTKVKEIGKAFGVKKLGDVPVEKAAELLAAVEKAEAELAAAA